MKLAPGSPQEGFNDFPLGCPVCKGRLNETSEGIFCGQCGRVGGRTFGIPDFLQGRQRLPLAGGASFDLEADEHDATFLIERRDLASFAELIRQTQEDSRSLAERRFDERYWRVCMEVGPAHGHAILTKVNTFLSSNDAAPIHRGVAVEGGGGEGFFLLGFTTYFEKVIFVDCSLRNILLAAKLVSEHSLTNVLFVRADLTALPMQDAKADMIHENGVIEHVADPTKMVREALRALSTNGTYICLSPNRYPISPEPHFRLSFFGIYPRVIRHFLVRLIRGVSDESGTELLSLRGLQAVFRAAGEQNPSIFFLPPGLPSTARSGLIRRTCRLILGWRGTAPVANFFINRLLLPIAPYHIAVVSPRRDQPHPT